MYVYVFWFFIATALPHISQSLHWVYVCIYLSLPFSLYTVLTDTHMKLNVFKYMLHMYSHVQIIWFGWSLVDIIGTCGILGNFRVKHITSEKSLPSRRTSRVSKQQWQLYWHHKVWHRLYLIKTSYLIWHWFKSYH